jgi:hypothetical protein
MICTILYLVSYFRWLVCFSALTSMPRFMMMPGGSEKHGVFAGGCL